MKKYIVILILLFTISGCSIKTSEATTRVYQTIKTEDVYKNIDSSLYKVIDVRTLTEYSTGHIKNSINIPLDNINNIEDYINDKNTKIVVYCRSGARSKEAANALLKLGYNYVYDMGGLNSWNYELIK